MVVETQHIVRTLETLSKDTPEMRTPPTRTLISYLDADLTPELRHLATTDTFFCLIYAQITEVKLSALHNSNKIK